MNEWFYKFPKNLPDVPEDFIERAYKSIKRNIDTTIDWEKINQEIITINGIQLKNTAFTSYHLDEEIKEWVYKNITDKSVVNVRVAESETSEQDVRDFKGAHCDSSRLYTLLYLLESGGDDHETMFYQEKGYPIVRHKGHRVFNHDVLTEICSVKIPLRKWCVLNSAILHGVRNIPKKRISIQIGLDSIEGLTLD